MWWRHGGYLVIRKSRWGWFPHVLWMSPDRSRLSSFVPINPRRHLIPPPLFRGYVKEGD